MSGQYLPLGCYGKLPCWPEYLEHNISMPGSRAFREWVREGRKEARIDPSTSEERPFQESAGCRFAFGLPGSAELVVGVIRPSADQTGRSHPFAVFVHLPRRQFGKKYNLVPMTSAPVWEALDDAWNGLASHNTRSAFDDQLGSSLLPYPDPVKQIRGTYQGMLQDEVGRIFRDVGRGSLEALEMNLPGLLPAIRKGGEDGRPVRLELPVSKEAAEACFDISFWIDLLDRQFFWHKLEPAIFIRENGKGSGRGVFLLFGPLEPAFYKVVMGGEGDDSGIERPAMGEGGGEAAGTFSSLLERRFRPGGQKS